MKKAIMCFVALLAIAAAATGPARAQSTSSLEFTDTYANGGATADDNVVWTVTSDGTESTFDNNKGIHYGTYSATVGYIELSTSGISGTITQVVVNASTASNVTATVSVTVGGNAFGGDAQSLSSTATDYTFTGSAEGAIVVRVAKPSAASKALYVKSIEVTYTSGGGSTPEPEQPQLYTVTFAEGTEDVGNWSITPDTAATTGVLEGAVVTVKYNGTRRIKSIEAMVDGTAILATPLTMEALTAGTIVVSSPKEGMRYSKNGGAKTAVTSDAITVAVGDKVAFYGNGTNITTYDGTRITGGDADVKVYGNIMSLVNEEHFDTATTLTTTYQFYNLFRNNVLLKDASGLMLPATTLTQGCYSGMFNGCTSLTTAPALPATTLAQSCYYGMFNGCAALTTAPALPATTLAQSCYSSMFDGCAALTTAPALPATELAQSCYSVMFRGCAALTTAPALPATTLANDCYSYMFYNCTSLTTAPELPAQTLVSNCYSRMFYNCTKLNSVTCLATSGINQNSSTDYWLKDAGSDVTSTKTFNAASTANWPEGNNGIPDGWTRQNIDN